MAFGISFGKNKSKTNQTATVDKTETGSQTGSTTTNQQTVQSSATQSSGLSQTQGQSNSSTVGSNTTAGASTQQQQQTTQNFSDATLGGLEAVVSRLLSSDSLGKSGYNSGFDPQAFVRDGMSAATARARTGLDEAVGGIRDAIGGRNNSAAALLLERVNNDSNAMLAGTQAQLTGQAEEIMRSNMLAGNTQTDTNNNFVANLLSALRGGISSTTGAVQENTSQSQQSQTSAAESTSQNQATQQSSSTQAIEQMASTLAQLIESITNTKGTETVKGKTSSGGFGLGLSV